MRPHYLFAGGLTQGSQHIMGTFLLFILPALFIFRGRSTSGGVAVEKYADVYVGSLLGLHVLPLRLPANNSASSPLLPLPPLPRQHRMGIGPQAFPLCSCFAL